MTVAAVALVVGLIGALTSSRTGKVGTQGDPVVLYDALDPEMNAAINAARATLDSFLAKLADPAFHPDSAALKVAIPYSGGAEHIFLTDIERMGPDAFVGTIDNVPDSLPNLVQGARYEFTRDQISDWNYFQDGMIHGSYTLRVMLPRLPAEQAEMFKAMLAPLPDRAGQ